MMRTKRAIPLILVALGSTAFASSPSTSVVLGTAEAAAEASEVSDGAEVEEKRGIWQKATSIFRRNSSEESGSVEEAAMDIAEAAASSEPVQSEDAGETAEEEDKPGMWQRATSIFRRDASPEAEVMMDAVDADASDSGGFWSDIWPSGAGRNLPAEELLEQTLGEDGDRFYSEGQASLLISDYEQLGLDEYLKLVAVSNDRIQYQKMEWAIARTGAESTRGMYDPAMTASYRYTDSLTPNTTEEEFRRSFAPVFDEKNHDYTLGVEQMFFTGGKVKFSYTYRQLENNIQPTPIRGEEDKTFTGLSLTQPILKGAGGRRVVEAPIHVANKDQQIAMQTYRQAQFETVANAAIVFWDVYVASRLLEVRQRSVAIAETVFQDEQERLRYGRSSETRVAAAQAAVAQRRVQLYGAQQNVVQARNDMRSFVAGMPAAMDLDVDAAVRPQTDIDLPTRNAAMEQAYLYRPEYLASKIRAEKEDVRIAFARNNSLPQLDLVASYGLNGLSDSFSDSFDDAWSKDFETTYVGLEYKMILGGNRKARSELSAAQFRKQQALLEIRAAEMAIQNSVDTAMHNLETARKQVQEMEAIVETQQRLLDVEMSRFQSGQSDSREVLEQEERLNEARVTLIESIANLQKAMVGLSLADGTLLQRYDLEV